MPAVLCSRCGASLSLEEVAARSPCRFCGTVNVPTRTEAAAALPDALLQLARRVTVVPRLCPKCGRENDSNSEFCVGCAERRLPPEAAAVFRQQAAREAAMADYDKKDLRGRLDALERAGAITPDAAAHQRRYLRKWNIIFFSGLGIIFAVIAIIVAVSVLQQ
jgi:hypothetical protein